MKKPLKNFLCAALCAVFCLFESLQVSAVMPEFAERQIFQFAGEFNSLCESHLSAPHHDELCNWKLRVMTYIKMLENYMTDKITRVTSSPKKLAKKEARALSIEALIKLQSLIGKSHCFSKIFEIETNYPSAHEIIPCELPTFAKLQLNAFVSEWSKLTDTTLIAEWKNRVLGYMKLISCHHNHNLEDTFFIELFIKINNRSKNDFLKTLKIHKGTIFVDTSLNPSPLVFELTTKSGDHLRLEIDDSLY